MVMAGLVAGAATVAYRNFSGTYSSTRVSRIKAKQTIVEAQVRRRALQPEAYLDCNSDNFSSCRVNPAYFADLGNQNVAGARCDGAISACGVAVNNPQFTPATHLFTASISYSGSEVMVKPVAISMEIPVEVLQAPRFHCGEKDKAKPIFVGFKNDTGEPICEGFNACPVGQFVRGVDLSKRTLICQDLPRNISCGEQSMFTRLGWQGHSVDYDCSPLPDPPFVSNLRTRVLASVTQPVTTTETLTNTSTDTGTDTKFTTDTRVTDPCTESPLRWLNDSNWSSGDAFNPRPGDPPDSAVCSFCYVGAPGAVNLPFNRDNGACSSEGEKCWCKNVFACRRECSSGGGGNPNPTPATSARTGIWTYYGMNENSMGLCPGGELQGTMFRSPTLGQCTNIGATCGLNVMGNALAGGGGHVRNYRCVEQ